VCSQATSFAVKQSIDDEYSPSIFKVANYKAQSPVRTARLDTGDLLEDVRGLMMAAVR
jgi:hypothetical protein